MGICIGSAVVPIAMCITWNKLPAVGAITGAITGLIGAFFTW